jgi:hypothetical protein
MRPSSASDPFAICEAIAADRALATNVGDYADGYRAAANDIARAIRAKRFGRQPTRLERDLRDVEMEARTLARIVAAAADVVTDMCDDASGAEAIRELLAEFFPPAEMPPELRPRTADESTTHLSSGRRKDVA